MATPRRIGAPDAKNRALLLDAAERLMLEEGYAAVTSRQVAAKAGLKPQLVHYYFRTMDDVFLAVFRRRAEEGLAQQAEALASDRPLRALWEFSTETERTAFTMEFAALTNHRKSIRAEVAEYSAKFREAQLKGLTGVLERYGMSATDLPPAVFVVLTTALARVLGMEDMIGLSAGHAETVAFVERWLDRIEGPVT
ncbi:TetR/AcrR family transcriptional regulator [Amycolatopsis sp. RTGN1]|uniref:TetR/AcrR family transcriptional regulator n=1 Tax=Amycolatopsis ponsaeliensis TaxID=2992142 RepID=UPI0025502C54|nr:TetR/AcrR family transcriptional regulator [Amycolatopsis sp. RTGN1]